MIKTARY